MFTPYKNAWLKAVDDFQVSSYAVEKYARAWRRSPPRDPARLADIGFAPTNLAELNMPVGMSGGKRLFDDFAARIERYKRARLPGGEGRRYLSTHLRFGTVSIRQLAAARGGEGARPGCRS